MDLDIDMGDVFTYFGREPSATIQDLMALGEGADRPIQAFGREARRAPVRVRRAARPRRRSTRRRGRRQVPARAAQQLPYLVVDASVDYSDSALVCFDLSDAICLVTGLDVVGVKHLSKALDTLLSIGLPRERFRVVLNRADSKVGLDASDVERVMKIQVDAMIPSSRLVPTSLNKGRPVVLDEPNSEVSQASASSPRGSPAQAVDRCRRGRMPTRRRQEEATCSSQEATMRQVGGAPRCRWQIRLAEVPAAGPDRRGPRPACRSAWSRRLGPRLYDATLSDTELEGLVHQRLRELLDEEEGPLSAQEKLLIVRQIGDSVLGLGPLEPFVRDPEVTEIMVNGWDTIYVERGGQAVLDRHEVPRRGQLRRTIDKIVAKVGRRVDEASPYVDARLPDGSRVNAIIPPLAIDGPSLTIRKFAADPYQADDLIEFGTMSSRGRRSSSRPASRGRVNIMVAGGTGAGKTTTLNVLSSFIPDDERIVTIEDAAELKLQQPHVVRLESRPPNIEGKGEVTIRDLVRNSLRMRPDRIVVGEVRGAEALDMLQAMNTGHDGSITTIHSNSPRDALSPSRDDHDDGRDGPRSRAIREQIASAIQLIVHQQRLKDGTRRFTHVTEVAGMEGEVITLQDMFLFDFSAGMDDEGRFRGRLKSTGLRPKFLDKLAGARRPHRPGALRAGAEGVGRCSAAATSSRARRCWRSSSPSWRCAAFALGWLLLGTAARVKADRDMAARMAAIGRPVPQSDGVAGRQAGQRVDPRERVDVRPALRRVAGLQREAGCRARGRGCEPAVGRVRGRHGRRRAPRRRRSARRLLRTCSSPA